jgi:hypothetical protein
LTANRVQVIGRDDQGRGRIESVASRGICSL